MSENFKKGHEPRTRTPTTPNWPFAYRVAEDRSLLGVSVRPPKEEVCDHCGATYTGLSHCQSLSQIKEIDDSEFIAALQSEAVTVGDLP